MAQNEGNLQRLHWFLADNQQRNGTSVLQPQGNENGRESNFKPLLNLETEKKRKAQCVSCPELFSQRICGLFHDVLQASLMSSIRRNRECEIISHILGVIFSLNLRTLNAKSTLHSDTQPSRFVFEACSSSRPLRGLTREDSLFLY